MYRFKTPILDDVFMMQVSVTRLTGYEIDSYAPRIVRYLDKIYLPIFTQNCPIVPMKTRNGKGRPWQKSLKQVDFPDLIPSRIRTLLR